MEWCFVITVSELSEGGESHIQWDSIWLDEDSSYRRIMEIVEDYSRSGIALINETITSRRGIIGRFSQPYHWTWESEGGKVIVSAERCQFGKPLIRTINPIRLVDMPDEVKSVAGEPEIRSGVGVQDGDNDGDSGSNS